MYVIKTLVFRYAIGELITRRALPFLVDIATLKYKKFKKSWSREVSLKNWQDSRSSETKVGEKIAATSRDCFYVFSSQ